jgi:3-hydroxybutyryl-CoA dehydrogenase
MTAPRTAPQVVAVIGGGAMGAGIAQVFAAAGSSVTVIESSAATAAAARDRIEAGITRAAEDSAGAGAAAALARVTVGVAMSALPPGAELVIEAVPEDAAVKVGVLTAAEQRAGADAVLATNTSSIAIGELAAALDRPGRFIGMHFFNPVPRSKLIEVVVGAATTETTRDRVLGWSDALGKTAVLVRDSPGFATSRLGVAAGLEAIRMLEDGVASAADIDTAVTLAYGHPMGPLRLTDYLGLDVRLAIAEYLQARLGDRFAPPELLRAKVARGELGRKSGQGFYSWDRP